MATQQQPIKNPAEHRKGEATGPEQRRGQFALRNGDNKDQAIASHQSWAFTRLKRHLAVNRCSSNDDTRFNRRVHSFVAKSADDFAPDLRLCHYSLPAKRLRQIAETAKF